MSEMKIAKTLKKGEENLIEVRVIPVTFDGNFVWGSSSKEQVKFYVRDSTVKDVGDFLRKSIVKKGKVKDE